MEVSVRRGLTLDLTYFVRKNLQLNVELNHLNKNLFYNNLNINFNQLFLLEVRAETNSTTHEKFKEVQVAIFSNESFSLEYTRFPIGVKLSKKIYVQVEGKTLFLY